MSRAKNVKPVAGDSPMEHYPPTSLGEKLRNRRKALALSMDQLNAMVGVDIATISRVENDSIQLTLDTAIQLSRGLRIPLTELVKVPRTQPPMPTESSVNALPRQVSSEDAAAFVLLFQTNQQQAKDLVVRWLNKLIMHINDTGDDPVSKEFLHHFAVFVLVKHNPLHLMLGLPANRAMVVVPMIYQLGGHVIHGDVQLLLEEISYDRKILQRLDRQGKEILRRLQSHTRDRIRLDDLAKLETQLQLDLIGILAVAERVSANDFDTTQERQFSPEKAQLLSLFVKIACWFSFLESDSNEWLQLMRSEIRQALQQAQPGIYPSTND